MRLTARVKTMRISGWLLAGLATVLTLAGCSSGGACGNSSFGGTCSNSATGGAAAITLITSSPQIPSDGSKPATITAIVRSASNTIVPNVAVAFSTTSGVIAPQTTSTTVAAGTTDSNGQAQASLSTPGDPSNRTIIVTAAVGTVSKTLSISVVGTKLALTGPSSLILASTGTYSASLTDAGGNAIANQLVTITSTAGNTLSTPSAVTDNSGHVTFTVTASKAGNDTITVSWLGASATQPLTAPQPLVVSGQSFNFNSPAANTLVPIGTAQTVTLLWTNNGTPVTGQVVTFSTTRGLFANNSSTTTATTDGTGTATVAVSSTTAGPAAISAAAAGVTAQLNLAFIATVPATIDVQASPATITTSGQSTITAIVRDVNLNLVEGQTVDFQLTDQTGGSISVATAITDSQGRAQTVYSANGLASAPNGVKVVATVQGTAISHPVFLTVGGQTVILSLGTGSTISENTQKTQFSMPFVIQAVDSGGNAVPGVTVTLTVHSLPPTGAPALTGPDYTAPYAYAAYRKGQWVLPASDPTDCPAQTTGWCLVTTALCLNEDALGTGIYNASEDLNNNGRLDPGDVAAVSPGTITTDNTGTANVNVTYPEDHAIWVQVILTATATVSGTESSTTSTFFLPILASYVTSTQQSPPGQISPYGVSASCASPN